jgi:2-polyprenyl-6-methoxyphenol hydroxylase-like FAD-dependent oxidoreductase
MVRHDVLIVGTRCAGAPLAMLLARKGYKVLAVDRARFPSDTISTHFMWPRTTSSLARWGLLDRLAATGCPEIDQVIADYGAISVHRARTIACRTVDKFPSSVSVQRHFEVA